VPPTIATTTTLPTSIEQLIALLAANPSAFGEKGPDLLQKLSELQGQGDRGNRIEKLADEVSEWMEKGELDPTIGALTLQILGLNTGSDFDGDSRGPGGGGGDGDD
jgi:hypothetical protein